MEIRRVNGKKGNKIELVNESWSTSRNWGHKTVVNYCNGKKYDDGSDFYDIRIFTNKRKMEKFVKELKKEGFIYG